MDSDWDPNEPGFGPENNLPDPEDIWKNKGLYATWVRRGKHVHS